MIASLRVLWLGFALVAAGSCKEATKLIAHPSADFMTRKHHSATIKRSVAPDLPEPLRRQLGSADWSLVPDRVPWKAGGFPLATVARDGVMHVLDRQTLQTFVVSPTGELIESFDRPANTFRNPLKLLIAPGKEMLVVDVFGKVYVFEPALANSGPKLRVAFETTAGAEDACLVGDRLFIAGWRPDGLIHEYSLSGEYRRSFAEGYKAQSSRLSTKLSSAIIACATESSAIVVAFRYLPLVEMYSTEGQLKWTSQIEDFAAVDVTENSQTQGIRYDRTNAHDVPIALTPLDRKHVLYQHSRLLSRSDPSVPRAREIHTYTIDTDTGHGTYVAGYDGIVLAGATTTLVMVGGNSQSGPVYAFHTREVK